MSVCCRGEIRVLATVVSVLASASCTGCRTADRAYDSVYAMPWGTPRSALRSFIISNSGLHIENEESSHIRFSDSLAGVPTTVVTRFESDSLYSVLWIVEEVNRPLPLDSLYRILMRWRANDRSELSVTCTDEEGPSWRGCLWEYETTTEILAEFSNNADTILILGKSCRSTGDRADDAGPAKAQDRVNEEAWSYLGGLAEFASVHTEMDEPPIMEHYETPRYPLGAYWAGWQDTVWVQALVGSDGRVIKAFATNRSEVKNCFGDAAVSAAFENRYRPARQYGREVAIWVHYRVEFLLDQVEVDDRGM